MTFLCLLSWQGPARAYEGRAFPAPLLKEMLDGNPARMLGPEAKYGLGVILRPTTLGPTYGYSGFSPGYLTEMMYLPDHKLCIAVQVNTSVPRATGKPLTRLLVELAQESVGGGGAGSVPPPAPPRK